MSQSEVVCETSTQQAAQLAGSYKLRTIRGREETKKKKKNDDSKSKKASEKASEKASKKAPEKASRSRIPIPIPSSPSLTSSSSRPDDDSVASPPSPRLEMPFYSTSGDGIAMEGTAQDDTSHVVDGLVGAIKSIAADSNYNLLAQVFQEVNFLRAKNKDLHSANRNILEEYYIFRKEFENERDALAKERDGLKEALAGKVQELADMTESRDSLDIQLNETKATLETTTGERNQLQTDLGAANDAISGLKTNVAGLEQNVEQLTTQLGDQKRLVNVTSQENAALRVSVSQKETQLENTKNELDSTKQKLQDATSRGDSLKTVLDSTELDLRAKNNRLTELDSYRITLREDPEDVFVKILDDVWTKLFDLVETHFQNDLEDRVLTDPSCWSNLRNAEALKGPTQIPLPQTNSPVAKGMRIAAVLSILSRTLHKHIFRPFYLLSDDDELTVLLHEAEGENPSREEHIRATLLATLPQLQLASAKVRTQHVVREVAWTVQHLLGAIAYDSFCNDLSSMCAVACTEWQKIQHARMKIELFFGPPYDEFDWQALPLPEFEGQTCTPWHQSRDSSMTRGTSTPRGTEVGGTDLGMMLARDSLATSSNRRRRRKNSRGKREMPPKGGNGDAAENGSDESGSKNTGSNDGDTEITATDDDSAAVDCDEEAIGTGAESTAVETDCEDEGEVDPDDILFVVWPSVVVFEEGDPQAITQGLVISKQQASLAYHEVRSARSALRGNSKKARTMSIPSMSLASVAASLRMEKLNREREREQERERDREEEQAKGSATELKDDKAKDKDGEKDKDEDKEKEKHFLEEGGGETGCAA